MHLSQPHLPLVTTKRYWYILEERRGIQHAAKTVPVPTRKRSRRTFRGSSMKSFPPTAGCRFGCQQALKTGHQEQDKTDDADADADTVVLYEKRAIEPNRRDSIPDFLHRPSGRYRCRTVGTITPSNSRELMPPVRAAQRKHASESTHKNTCTHMRDGPLQANHQMEQPVLPPINQAPGEPAGYQKKGRGSLEKHAESNSYRCRRPKHEQGNELRNKRKPNLSQLNVVGEVACPPACLLA